MNGKVNKKPQAFRVRSWNCLLLLVSAASTTAVAQRAESYQSLTEDGAWCWFSDPRSVYHSGNHQRTYTGFVTAAGDITVAAKDHQTGEVASRVLYKGLQADDHVNPSLLILPDGRIMAFFCYALAYGVRSGLLDRDEYEPAVYKAWKALVSAVYPDGKLGWVQPIGEDPRDVTAEMTEVYGVGAFLLAGTELLQLAK